MSQIAFFNTSTQGINIIVPAPSRAAQTLRILGGILFAAGTVTVTFGDSTLQTYGSPLAMTAGQIVSKDLTALGGFVDIPAGRAFGFNLSAAVGVTGFLVYEVI